MELLLALAVVTAVIIFGALISLGNERQRRAVDELREQAVLWAIQDLSIKRGHLEREVHVDDPLQWLNQIATKTCGYDLNLQIVEIYKEPSALVCAVGGGYKQVLFSPLSPSEIRNIQKGIRSRLSQVKEQNPLLFMPRTHKVYEISMLNGDILFDIEVDIVWSKLTGNKIYQMKRIWMYMIK
ncbi:MAG TPA: hypothetical protein PLN86_16790 [Candidatus Hydrogenedentes bacterium]|nr:hypothetical protein [Candidatus Hydrogenedentota bacterium]